MTISHWDKSRKFRIMLALLTACILASNCRAEELKPAIQKPLKHIYLTFDDGPLEGSEDIDDAVRAEKIKINVFVVGLHVRALPRMRNYFQLYENNPFIELGNHSFSHAHDEYRLFYKDPESVYQDFIKNERILQLKSKLVRLPGRNMWRIGNKTINDVNSGATAADLLSKKGYSVFGWDLEWQHDARTGAPVQTVNDIFHQIDRLLKERRTATEGHIVILCHDEMFRKSWEESELKELIDRLKSAELYEFNHLGEYPLMGK
jgi:peptidoglycan/xylan/chitin deacetylase (PgdA/CDA1 family)